MIRAQTRFGSAWLGPVTRVVGTVSQPDTLAALHPGEPRTCDIVEVRLDLLGPASRDWAADVARLEAAGWPVIVTIRLANEGGKWAAADRDRLPLFDAALEVATAVDIEFRSPSLPAVSGLAVKHQKALVVSYHDFERTPPLAELRDVMNRAANFGTVVKFATLTKDEDDLGTLRDLFRQNCSAALCVLGMGPLGPLSRRELPRLGSCLTYGYLDQPIAPGQPAAADLMPR